METKRKCACCGKEITKGYVWDGTDVFCGKSCAAKALGNDMGCVNILICNGRLKWKDNIEGMKTFNISTPCDVADFFTWIVFNQKINFHPDDSFLIYVSYEDGTALFSPTMAEYYDKTMQSCFEVCKKYERDIYKIAQIVMGLYSYCDCNDEMANFCLHGV